MRRLMLSCVLGLLLCPLVGRAQNSIATPDGVVTALRLGPGDVIRLDGVPDEAVWKRAAVATGFLQREPDNGAPATESTEVRLVYDDDRLILGVVLRDSEPERILGNQMQRDQSFAADDRFMWTIDSFLDGRSGYYFEINPSGAMGDGLVDPALRPAGRDYLGSGINRSWDGVWLARVGRTPAGWAAEIEIPFRTLNFDRTASAWGINFQRTVRRKSENSLWMGYALNQGLARMSNAGRVEGIEGISQGLGLDLKPYVVGSVSSAPGLGQPSAHPTADVGIDAFYSLTPALRANLSVNTDFAETEVDVRRVNLTRFPLFFEEKRDFFLEGSSFFDFAREPDESVIPFFSRRIGLERQRGAAAHRFWREADRRGWRVRRGCAPGAHGGRGKHRGERRPRGRGLFGVSRAAPRPPAVVLRRPVYAPVGSSTRQQRSPHGRARFPVADVDLSKRSQPGVQRILCGDERAVRRGRQCGLRPSRHLSERSHQPGDFGPGDPAATTTPPSASSSGGDIGA